MTLDDLNARIDEEERANAACEYCDETEYLHPLPDDPGCYICDDCVSKQARESACGECGGRGYHDRPNSPNPYVLHYTEECDGCCGTGRTDCDDDRYEVTR